MLQTADFTSRLRKRLSKAVEPQAGAVQPADIVDWAQDRFYIIETKRPVKLQPVQRAVLEAFSAWDEERGRFKYTNLLYSTIKKSGKTAMAALYQRWAAECWGDFGEIYHMGNKLEQAKERAFKITAHSIELAPANEQKDWDLQKLTLTFIPKKSFIKALPVSAKGEAGGNQCLTTWTELWGYMMEDEERMFTEMQPVPTQIYSQRFMESYAGYEGESNLLKTWWDLADPKNGGVRIHDEYPIFANGEVSLCAYIDEGEEARRMPWQTGETGRQYYATQAKTELPYEYTRLHENRWTANQNQLIPLDLWDELERDPMPDIMPGEMVVIAVDGSVSGDCTAMVVVAINRASKEEDLVCREVASYIWYPKRDGNSYGKLDYDAPGGLKPILDGWLRRVKVREVAYDPYQLHDVMTQMHKRFKGMRFYEFSQGQERLEADTKLVKRIRDGKILHRKNPETRVHVQYADGKVSGTDKQLRIVKRDEKKKIDWVVALSMAVERAFSLPQSRSPLR